MSSAAVGAGSVLSGRYRLVEPLASGGMGTVWRALDLLLDRPVAVKEVRLPPGLDDDARKLLRRRTIREAQVAARLRHPAIVTIFDVVEQDDRPWIVMELVQSQSLADIIRGRGPLAPVRVAGIGLRVLDAMVAAAAAGVEHRDIKPANVLVTDEGRVVLTDFGIARHVGDETLTSAGLIIGSPDYLAPERARGRSGGLPADLWSLGATMYDAVEGRRPFERNGPLPTLAAVVMDEPDPPQRAGPLRPVIDGLLIKDPAHRLDAEQTRKMLQRVLRGRPVGGTMPFPRRPLDDRLGGRTPPPIPPRPTAEPPTVIVPVVSEPTRDEPTAVEHEPTPDQPIAVEHEPTPDQPIAVEHEPTPDKPTAVEHEPTPDKPTAVEGGPGAGTADGAQTAGTEEAAGSAGVPTAAAGAAAAGAAAVAAGALSRTATTPGREEPDGIVAAPSEPAPPEPADAGATERARTEGGAPRVDDGQGTTWHPTLADSAARAGTDDPVRRDTRTVPGAPADSTRKRRALLVGLVVLVLAGVIAILVPALSDDPPDQATGPAPTAAPNGGAGGVGAPARSGDPTRSTTRPSPSARRTTGAPTPTSAPTPASAPSRSAATPATGARVAAPTGFTRYTDPRDGFSLVIPAGWRAVRRDTRVDFDDPSSSRFLRIDTSDTPLADPYQNWIDYERQFRQGKSDYQNLDIRRVRNYRPEEGWTTADWEFTLGGTHVLDRNIRVSDARAHAIYWSTPQSQWDTAQSRQILQLAEQSFVPAPVGG
jgi:eukaryotic-like serine/threonine-protein kinase